MYQQTFNPTHYPTQSPQEGEAIPEWPEWPTQSPTIKEWEPIFSKSSKSKSSKPHKVSKSAKVFGKSGKDLLGKSAKKNSSSWYGSVSDVSYLNTMRTSVNSSRSGISYGRELWMVTTAVALIISFCSNMMY